MREVALDGRTEEEQDFYMLRWLIAGTVWCAFVSGALGGQSSIPPAPPAHESAAQYWKYWRPSPKKSVEVGNFYLKRGDLKAAISRYKQAIKAEPDYAPAYLGLGKAYERLNEAQKSLDAYEKYLAELPSDRAAARAKEVHKAIARLKRQIANSARGNKSGPAKR